MRNLVPQVTIEKRIFVIRGCKVMLDMDLADLFGVTTRNLKRQVKRNIQRFPQEFMFQLTKKERGELVPIWHQFNRAKYSSVLPYAFTEHGVAMLASVLNSERAIKMSIIIIKTFIKLREIVFAHREFAYKLKELEQKVDKHDVDIQQIIKALNRLIDYPLDKKRVIRGFGVR